jgi:hypothetical protein
MDRQEHHDQTKLRFPEVDIFHEFTPLLRGITYGSKEYKKIMEKMRPAIKHHNENNRHHPEYHEGVIECLSCGTKYYDQCAAFCNVCCSSLDDLNIKITKKGINGMTLIDLIEMICDWIAAGLRHADGDIFKSIKINKERFDISDQLTQILINTAEFLNSHDVYHNAEES